MVGRVPVPCLKQIKKCARMQKKTKFENLVTLSLKFDAKEFEGASFVKYLVKNSLIWIGVHLFADLDPAFQHQADLDPSDETNADRI